MGRGAKIFFIALLAAGCVFGLISFAIVSALRDAASPIGDRETLREGAVTDKYAFVGGDSFNLLVINTDYRPELYSYDKARVNAIFGDAYGEPASGGSEGAISLLSAVLVRADKERGQFTFTPISSKTLVNNGEKSISLAKVYETYGASELCRHVHLLTGLTVDDYVTVIPSVAQKIADLVGGVEYSRLSSASAQNEEDVPSGKGTVNGNQVRTLLLCDYSGSSITRERVASELLKAFFEKLCTYEKSLVENKLEEAVSMLHTSINDSKVKKNTPLVLMYGEFQKVTLELCGKYTEAGFLPDAAQTIDKFSVYRKYYG